MDKVWENSRSLFKFSYKSMGMFDLYEGKLNLPDEFR